MKANAMLYNIAIVLVILWLLGLVSGCTIGAFIHVLLVVPIVLFFLRLKGISGDKRLGIQQLDMAAARGRYLRPFAKILLALVALREKQTALARVQLEELVAEFPGHPLFVRELARLEGPSIRPPAR